MIRWPLVEALHAFRAVIKSVAREDYKHAVLVWAVQSPYLPRKDRKPPPIPDILKEPRDPFQ